MRLVPPLNPESPPDDGIEQHPTEIARQALMRAADVETPLLAIAIRQVADSLPWRAPIGRRRSSRPRGRRNV